MGMVADIDVDRKLLQWGDERNTKPPGTVSRMPSPTEPDGDVLAADGMSWERSDPDRDKRLAIDSELLATDAKLVRRMEDYFSQPGMIGTLDQSFRDDISARVAKRTERGALRQPV